MADEKKKPKTLGKRKKRSDDFYRIYDSPKRPKQYQELGVTIRPPKSLWVRLRKLEGVIIREDKPPSVPRNNIKEYYISGFEIQILESSQGPYLCKTPAIFMFVQPTQLSPKKTPPLRVQQITGWQFQGMDNALRFDLSNIISTFHAMNDQIISFLLGMLPNRGRNDDIWILDKEASTPTTRVERKINRGPQSSIFRAFTSILAETNVLELVCSYL